MIHPRPACQPARGLPYCLAIRLAHCLALWLAVCLILSQLTACAGQPIRARGFHEANATRAELDASLAPQRWAVVIGVADYRDPTFTPLRHTRNDASEVARVLKDPRFGGFDRVITLTSPETTTRDAILFELRRIRNDLQRQDTLLVYFSGHGTLEVAADGQADLYLAASDTRAHDLAATGIDLAVLRGFLAELKPQRKVMVLDSCFAGQGKSRLPTATRSRLDTLPDPFLRTARGMGQSEALLMASTLGGVAQEDDRLQHGTYTWFLLQALTSSRDRADANHDGAVTAYEAHDFARGMTSTHTGDTQVPEGYFRVIGRADMYLSGRPDPALAKAAALVYAYGLEAERPLRISIDGRPKGAFPQAIAVDPGQRRITIRDENGRLVADGRLEFARGQVYPIGLLLEELQGYRRFFGLETGGTFHAGPLEQVWGESAPRVGLVSGYRVRGGALRGLSVSFHLGWTPLQGGAWKALSPEAHRSRVDLGARLLLRRSRGRLQGGVGWQVTAVYTPAVDPVGEPAEVDTGPLRSLDRWLTVPTGPVLWQGIALNRNLLLTLEEQLAWFPGAFDGGRAGTNLAGGLSMGLELGF